MKKSQNAKEYKNDIDMNIWSKEKFLVLYNSVNVIFKDDVPVILVLVLETKFNLNLT